MVKYEKLKNADEPATLIQPDKKSPKRLKVKDIEKLAVKHESFGFGRVDAHGLTTHGFDPKGLLKFVRAIEALARS